MSFQKLRRIYFGKEYSGKYENTAQHHFRSDRLLEEPYGKRNPNRDSSESRMAVAVSEV